MTDPPGPDSKDVLYYFVVDLSAAGGRDYGVAFVAVAATLVPGAQTAIIESLGGPLSAGISPDVLRPGIPSNRVRELGVWYYG